MIFKYKLPAKLKDQDGNEIESHLNGYIEIEMVETEKLEEMSDSINHKIGESGVLEPLKDGEKLKRVVEILKKQVKSVDAVFEKDDYKLEMKSVSDLMSTVQGRTVMIGNVLKILSEGIDLGEL